MKSTNNSPKKKSEFDWEDTGNLKIRYDDDHSAALRFFPSDKVIKETLAKYAKKPANRSKAESNTISPTNKKKS